MATVNLPSSVTLNVSGDSALDKAFQTYYDRLFLKNVVGEFVYADYGQKRPIPKNAGKTISFRKPGAFTPSTTPLTEGTTPDGQAMSITEITATLAQYGGYAAFSDFLEMTIENGFLNEQIAELGVQGGKSIEQVVRGVLAAGTVIQRVGGGAQRDAITASNVLTVDEVRKARRTLEVALAPKFGAGSDQYYLAIVSPESTYDLQSDTKWIDASKYAANRQLLNGELGELYGVRFVQAGYPIIFDNAGASSIDIYGTLVIGKDAYALTAIGSHNAKTIIKNVGSGGTDDPLNQRGTAAWKVNAFVAKILDNTRMVRIEHAVTA